MNQLSYTFSKTSLISQEAIATSFEHLKAEIDRLEQAQSLHYQSPYGSINLPSDTQMHAGVMALVTQKKKLNPSMLIVVGIGGSHLGTLAIHQALNGLLYNELNPACKVYFADTIDQDYIDTIILLMQQTFAAGGHLLLNVITKSGTTTETIANFELLFSYLQKRYGDQASEYVVVTTDEGSPLWDYAQEKKMSCLMVPHQVGGRYSVFSAVGQFPLAFLGVSVQELLEGARKIIPACLSKNVAVNYAAQRAILLFYWYQQGFTIHDTFLFSLDLEGIGRWYRQLMGESIGKQYDLHGKEVFVGITPTVSLGTTDLHSVGQLYLGGPYNKSTTFISVARDTKKLAVPAMPAFKALLPDIQGKSFFNLMQAVLGGVQQAYREHSRPFDAFVLPEKTASNIGQLMQIQMIEMIYLGYLLTINPFDQPNVELYKSQTRRLLADG